LVFDIKNLLNNFPSVQPKINAVNDKARDELLP